MAKIVVFGASGKAGKEIAAVAEARGHEVTRIGHDPGAPAPADPSDELTYEDFAPAVVNEVDAPT